MGRICVIPGSYDPVTVGHADLIRRAALLFDGVHAVVFRNSAKEAMFTLEARVEMLRAACGGMANVTVAVTDGLLADYAAKVGAAAIVKGVRSASDLNYEGTLAAINREIGGAETVLLPARAEHSFISSSFVREMLRYGKDVSKYVPEAAIAALRAARF